MCFCTLLGIMGFLKILITIYLLACYVLVQNTKQLDISQHKFFKSKATRANVIDID